MINYSNNNRVAMNPRARGARFWGLASLGRFGPRQADAYDPSSGGDSAPILTQVVDWPWDVDEAGIAFDRANIVGVRTRCWSVDGGGDKQEFVAVPRVLPSGYTAAARCGRIVPLIQDFLGNDPLNGVIGMYSDRQPVYWRTADGIAPWPEGSLWTPMNFSQKTVKLDPPGGFYSIVAVTPSITASNPGNSCNGFIPWSSTVYNRTTYMFPPLRSHVGFRGGKVRFGNYSNYSPLACGITWAGDFGLIVGYMNSLGTSPVAPALPDVILYNNSWDVSALVNIGPGLGPNGFGSYAYRWELDIDLPALSPPLGQVKDFFVMVTSHTTGDGAPAAQWAKMAPRTDVPLWYFASQNNLVAPGGTVT